MTAPASPVQVANGLDAWAKGWDVRHRQVDVMAPVCRDLRRAAALIRDQQAEIAQLRADLDAAQQCVVDLTAT